ncbi:MULTISPECIES: RNA polymerase sigma factor [Streptomyces]|uniref:RNA polymerase sigma factor n=1 Tax=Streptomyces TaxID=1883 RepID=UPI002248A681|nr:sigma-70 family RNA polymerase sigma factor [Streptomyces sp. JHD 1]MCX2971895.1 sigma-70 family RNA polymerase sigma factor [Streptomyces sp. JHD 1]
MRISIEERFTEVYRSHRAAVERYVMRRAHADVTADIVAEVFLTAWRKADAMPANDALPWLYGVARRVLANHRRAQQRRADLTDLLAAQPQGVTVNGTEGVIAREDLARAMGELSESDQEILKLVLWEDLTPAVAAVVLGSSNVATRVRFHRARQRLRRRLEPAYDNAATKRMRPKGQEVTHVQP